MVVGSGLLDIVIVGVLSGVTGSERPGHSSSMIKVYDG